MLLLVCKHSVKVICPPPPPWLLCPVSSCCQPTEEFDGTGDKRVFVGVALWKQQPVAEQSYLVSDDTVQIAHFWTLLSKDASLCDLGIRTGCLPDASMERWSGHVHLEGDPEVDPGHTGHYCISLSWLGNTSGLSQRSRWKFNGWNRLHKTC